MDLLRRSPVDLVDRVDVEKLAFLHRVLERVVEHRTLTGDRGGRRRATGHRDRKGVESRPSDIRLDQIDDRAGPVSQPLQRRRFLRLFTNINRNVKTTTAQENLALDEDDGFAVLTRRLLDEHEFLKRNDVVRVFTRQGDDGDLRLAHRQVPVNSPAWTTIGVLYDIVRKLGFGLHSSMYNQSQRATDEVLDDSYDVVAKRLDELMDACGNLRGLYEAQRAPKDLRAPKGRDGQGHAFMRPAVQAQIAKAVHDIMEEDLLDWPALMKRLKTLDWRMSAVPFSAVWLDTPNMSRKGKMATGKDQSGLLYDLLRVHLAPSSKTQITRAMRNYRDHKKENYPISMSDLMAHLSTEVV